MLRIFVDSGSSIKQEEKEKLNVELIPLRYLMGDEEYEDGVDLSIDEFYELLIGKKLFPKTSLPRLDVLQEKVTKYTNNGDDVIIITISSGISGTFSAIKTLFEENKKVTVIDSLSAVGGIRILVEEINRNREDSVKNIVAKINALIPRLKIAAIPENLDYLLKGGRLSKKEWIFGSILNIKPIITFVKGKVKVLSKKIGLKNAMKALANCLKEFNCDENYPIVASYTYNPANLDTVISQTDKKYHSQMTVRDNLDPVIASHWGPNAFGYIFVSKE